MAYIKKAKEYGKKETYKTKIEVKKEMNKARKKILK